MRGDSMSDDGTKNPDAQDPQSVQPDDDASSDGDRSWTADPITADPDEDRSVDAVIARTSGRASGETDDQGEG
jgi:hypothetical protein